MMALADVVVPVNPFKILQWMRHPSRESYFEWGLQFTDINPQNLFKTGNFEGEEFHIFRTMECPLLLDQWPTIRSV